MKTILLIILCLLTWLISSYITPTFDVIDNDNTQLYGKIISITEGRIQFRQNCDGRLKTYPFSDGISIKFNTQCKEPGYTMSSSPVIIFNPCTRRKIYTISFKKFSYYYANDIQLDSEKLVVNFANGQTRTYLRNSLNESINWIVLRNECESEIQTNFTLPNGL
ncbi:hypothetical protein GCM10028803_05300 [Larkinella knui]|uniref:Uncharacterized protein n=1 Tax=Larkinella knui TaxID=2025310 RepID=A0A3P1CKD0_9BACT|nr:hypothetical protein [Larkinella knui]RRB13792.1 hypothetical protein EHT87_16165 [Larkinella knui]